MDRVIQKAINWEIFFLKIMEQYGYEIKFGKYIAFKQKIGRDLQERKP